MICMLCSLPHVPQMTCDELKWCISAPTEDEAFKRTMEIAERIRGEKAGADERTRHRASFREDVARRGRLRDREN